MRVIITGAGRGIGAGIAEVLAEAGHAVGLVARTADTLRQVADRITGAGGTAVHAAIDVADPEQVERGFRDLIEQLGGVDALVNNAGVMVNQSTLQIDPADWRRQIDVNVHGPFYCTRAVLRRMIDQQAGHIVNVGSISSYHPLPGASGYATSKHALLGFTESLFQEVRQQGVKVSGVYPGSVNTGMQSAGGDWMVQPREVGQAVREVLQTRSANLVSRVEIRPAAKPRR